MEQFAPVAELGFELLADFRPNFITATVDAGADCSPDVKRSAAKTAAHFADAFFNNAFYRATPAGMKHANGALPRVYDNDRQTIGRQNSQQDAPSACDQAIANESQVAFVVALNVSLVIDTVDQIRMNLARGHQRRSVALHSRVQLFQERLTIAFDSAMRIVFGEAQIQ